MTLLFADESISLLHLFFFFNDTATTEIYTLSLHDALPILAALTALLLVSSAAPEPLQLARARRKSTTTHKRKTAPHHRRRAAPARPKEAPLDFNAVNDP